MVVFNDEMVKIKDERVKIKIFLCVLPQSYKDRIEFDEQKN